MALAAAGRKEMGIAWSTPWAPFCCKMGILVPLEPWMCPTMVACLGNCCWLFCCTTLTILCWTNCGCCFCWVWCAIWIICKEDSGSGCIGSTGCCCCGRIIFSCCCWAGAAILTIVGCCIFGCCCWLLLLIWKETVCCCPDTWYVTVDGSATLAFEVVVVEGVGLTSVTLFFVVAVNTWTTCWAAAGDFKLRFGFLVFDVFELFRLFFVAEGVTNSIPAAAIASLLSLAFRDGMLADGGPWMGTPASFDLLQCRLIWRFKLNFVVNALRQFHQHFTRALCVNIFVPKITKPKITREKLCEALLYEKFSRKILIKLTPCRSCRNCKCIEMDQQGPSFVAYPPW